MKKYWKRLEELGTALKLRPFRNARLKLTALYVLNTLVVLSVFLVALGYFRIQYLREDLAGNLAPGVNLERLVQTIYTDMQVSTAILAVFVLIAMSVLSYFFVHITLKPIREFVEAQRRFISDASHELRTPLATVKTENEVALLDPSRITRDEAISLLESNVEEVNRISTILNNLLNLASFNSATGAPPFAVVDLSATAELIVSRIKMLAGRKDIQLKVSTADNVLVWGNATALEEVVSNLLKNAIQYTPAGGEVSIQVKSNTNERKGELIVRDTGVGIAESELPYIFEPFYRSEKSLHMHQQGNGLGLPLVREIVKRHHGTLDIQSVVGNGTVASVLIPLASAAKIEMANAKKKKA